MPGRVSRAYFEKHPLGARGIPMSVTRDKRNGTWYVQAWYKTYDGKRAHKVKRGFKTSLRRSRGSATFTPCSREADIPSAACMDAVDRLLETPAQLHLVDEETVACATFIPLYDFAMQRVAPGQRLVAEI